MKAGLFGIAAAFLITALCLTGCDGRVASETETFTLKLDDGAALTVDNTTGTTVITGGDTDELVVKATKYVRTFRVADSLQSVLDQIEVSVTGDGSSAEVKWTKPLRFPDWLRWVHVDYEITVPRNVSIDLKYSTGSGTVEEITGDVTMDYTTGSGELKNIAGDVESDYTTGSLLLDGITGDITVTGTTGDTTMDNVEGNIDVTWSTGDVDITCPGYLDPDISIQAKGTTGDFTLRLPENSAFDVALHVTTGSVDNGGFDFPETDVADDSVNGGGADINVSLTTGDITFVQLNPAEADLSEELLTGLWTGTGALNEVALEFSGDTLTAFAWDPEVNDWYSTIITSWASATAKAAGDLVVAVEEIYNPETGLMDPCVASCEDTLSLEMDGETLEIIQSSADWFEEGIYRLEE